MPLATAPGHLRVDAEWLPWINYALTHCGLPQVARLALRNESPRALSNLLVRIWIPDFGDLWQKSFDGLLPGRQVVEEGIRIHLYKERLQRVTEATSGTLQITVTAGNDTLFARTEPIRVQPFNQWVYDERFPELLAAFIMPNSKPTAQVLDAATPYLKELTGETALDGYQSGDPEKVDLVVEAVYRALQDALNITYIGAPPSFEQAGQKIVLPHEILEHQRGTCLDLALFLAGCLERAGISPVIFLVPGHAFLGYWRAPIGFEQATVRDLDVVRAAYVSGQLAAINSTTFTNENRPIDVAAQEGRKYLDEMQAGSYAIDVCAARHAGVHPID